MRLNCYAEEVTDEVVLVDKTVTDDEFGTRTFYGIRVFLKSPSELHHSAEDDDRSAITFWIPDKPGGAEVIGGMLSHMQRELSRAVFAMQP